MYRAEEGVHGWPQRSKFPFWHFAPKLIFFCIFDKLFPKKVPKITFSADFGRQKFSAVRRKAPDQRLVTQTALQFSLGGGGEGSPLLDWRGGSNPSHPPSLNPAVLTPTPRSSKETTSASHPGHTRRAAHGKPDPFDFLETIDRDMPKGVWAGVAPWPWTWEAVTGRMGAICL